MATKWKNMITKALTAKWKNVSPKKACIWIGVFVLAAMDMMFLSRRFYAYNRWDAWFWMGGGEKYDSYGGRICFVAAVVFAILAILAIRSVRKEHKFDKMVKAHAVDRIKTEVLAIILIACLWQYIYWIKISGYELWGSGAKLRSIESIFRMLFITSFVNIVFLGNCLLLWRKYQLGIFRETTLVLHVMRTYKENTPLVKRLWRRRRASLLVATAAAIFGMTIGIYIEAYERMEEETFLLLVVVIFLYVIAMKNICSFKRSAQVNILVSHIYAMAQGEDLSMQKPMNPKALLYGADMELRNIEAAIRESARQQMQAERLKMDLITNVSHDLKTPLTSMVAYTDLLKKEELSPEAMDYVEAISAKQQHLKDMIQSVFELSKSTSGVEELHMEHLDMKRLVEQMLGDMEEQIQASTHVIRTRYEGGQFPFVADNSKMYRVMQNLLENALKYSLEGTRIHIELSQTEDGQVRLEMKNIASYEMEFRGEEMLERFARADQARTAGGGHGLGLAITDSYIRNMGGQIRLEVDGDMFKAIVSFRMEQEAGLARR